MIKKIMKKYNLRNEKDIDREIENEKYLCNGMIRGTNKLNLLITIKKLYRKII